MSEQLYRFENSLTQSSLIAELDGTEQIQTQKIPYKADLARIDSALTKLGKKVTSPDSDQHLMAFVHATLKHLPRAVLCDARFWQWLSARRFPDYVWIRWFDGVPSDVAAELASPSRAMRFLGGTSLSGMSRHGLARLYWVGDQLYDPKAGYDYAREALRIQDFEVAVFQRRLGLVPVAVRALVGLTKGSSGKAVQEIVRRLNHIATTVALEMLSESDVKRLMT